MITVSLGERRIDKSPVSRIFSELEIEGNLIRCARRQSHSLLVPFLSTWTFWFLSFPLCYLWVNNMHISLVIYGLLISKNSSPPTCSDILFNIWRVSCSVCVRSLALIFLRFIASLKVYANNFVSHYNILGGFSFCSFWVKRSWTRT